MDLKLPLVFPQFVLFFIMGRWRVIIIINNNIVIIVVEALCYICLT